MPQSARDQTQALRWLQEHGDALWRFALSRAPAAEAEDLIQETLLAAMGSVESFAGRSSEQTWLIGILSHKITDYYRRRARGAVPLDDASEMSTDLSDTGMWGRSPEDWSRQPDAALLDLLRQCRAALPPILADTLELRDLRQIPPDVVCQVLGITPTNLWARLHRARYALRQCIDSKLRGGPSEQGERGSGPEFKSI